MSINKVTSNQGEVRWEVRAYENGRGSREIRKRFERKIDAERFESGLEQLRREREINPLLRSSSFQRSFQEEADYWYLDAQLRISPGTKKRVLGFFAECMGELGQCKLDKITPEFLTKFQQTQKAKGLSNGTVNRKMNIILAILNHSTKHRRIPFNPTVGFRKLRENPPEMQYWSQQEASQFLKFISERYPQGVENRWVYVAYLLALNTGLRAGEIWGLKPMDINTKRGLIVVRRQFNRVSKELTETKGKATRVVPCNDELAAELQNIIRQNKVGLEDLIFKNKTGNFVDHDNFLGRQYDKDVKAWGGRRIRFHDMRHTATTLMIAGGIDLKTVKEICGHSSIETTMNYVHLVDGMIERVAKSFSVTGFGEEDLGQEVR